MDPLGRLCTVKRSSWRLAVGVIGYSIRPRGLESVLRVSEARLVPSRILRIVFETKNRYLDPQGTIHQRQALKLPSL